MRLVVIAAPRGHIRFDRARRLLEHPGGVSLGNGGSRRLQSTHEGAERARRTAMIAFVAGLISFSRRRTTSRSASIAGSLSSRPRHPTASRPHLSVSRTWSESTNACVTPASASPRSRPQWARSQPPSSTTPAATSSRSRSKKHGERRAAGQGAPRVTMCRKGSVSETESSPAAPTSTALLSRLYGRRAGRVARAGRRGLWVGRRALWR